MDYSSTYCSDLSFSSFYIPKYNALYIVLPTIKIRRMYQYNIHLIKIVKNTKEIQRFLPHYSMNHCVRIKYLNMELSQGITKVQLNQIFESIIGRYSI